MLTAEQIALIEETHAPTMQRLGYDLFAGPYGTATADDQKAAPVAALGPIQSLPLR
jgi:hypothetical protein